MREPFELEWLGGPTERAFRQLRPGVDDFPWGTLDPSRYPPVLVERARVSWTEAAWNEYCTAAAFTSLLRALLEAKAPIDLTGMASDFVVDEMLHVELTSRIAMELGGGAPYQVDFEALTLPNSPGLTPFQRANEEVVRTCCVAEAFSVPMLATCMKTAAHPLTRAVLQQIVKDEAPHGRFGTYYLEWAANHMDAAERARLGAVALDMLRMYAPFWSKLTSRAVEGVTTEGFLLQHVNELGWAEAETYARTARQTVRDDILAPLATFDIHPDAGAVEALLAQGALH
ncbi:MAG: ferritin-like domain-containing protein [Myxococcota bacterium]